MRIPRVARRSREVTKDDGNSLLTYVRGSFIRRNAEVRPRSAELQSGGLSRHKVSYDRIRRGEIFQFVRVRGKVGAVHARDGP